MVKKIKVNSKKYQGLSITVDDEDYEYLNQFKWAIQPSGKTYYAIRTRPYNEKGPRTIRMHHSIIGHPGEGMVTDHKDGNGLNNTRSNLHHVTPRENTQNMRNKKYASKYPGVIWDTFTNKWKAQIKINGKPKALGRFDNEEDAYNKYLEACELIKEGNENKITPHKHRFKYVSRKGRRWVARKTYEGKRCILGYYDKEEEALDAIEKFNKERGLYC